MATNAPRIPLPADWPSHVRRGILHVISLAQVALTAVRARAKRRGVAQRLRAKVEEQAGEISLLTEELELKDLRVARVKPRRRPHYRGTERLRILELKAARGWSKAQAADRFFLRPATIAEWTRRRPRGTERTHFVETPESINRFPGLRSAHRDSAEGALPDDGKEEDRSDACPCGSRPGSQHRRSHAQGT